MKSESFLTGSQSDCSQFVRAWVLIEREWNLQKVQADRGILSRRAVPADPQYRAGHPNPEGLKDQEDPDRREDTLISCFEWRFIQLTTFNFIIFYPFWIFFPL